QVIPPRFQRRPAVAPKGFISFGRDDASLPGVFVHNGVLADLAEAARQALPNEVIGLVYGRAWQDAEGPWVVVQHFVSAEPGESEATPGHCHLTAEGSARLRRRAEARYLGDEPVGWAHSHAGWDPAFSRGDLD